MLTEREEVWLKRAHLALELLQQKRVAADILLRNRRAAMPTSSISTRTGRSAGHRPWKKPFKRTSDDDRDG